METAGIIVFVVSAIVILAMPTIFLWMLFHTHREHHRWRKEAKRETRQALKKERREQAALMRERARRKQVEEQTEQESELRGSDDHGGSYHIDAREKKQQ